MLFWRLVLTGIFLSWGAHGLYAQGGRHVRLLQGELKSLQLSAPPDSSFLELREDLEKALQEKDNAAAGSSLRQMGRICYHMGHYPQALDYHLQASGLLRLSGKQDMMAENLNDLGIVYFFLRQPARAREQFNEALTIFRRRHNTAGIAATFGHIGFLYEKQFKVDSSFYYQRSALALYQQSGNLPGMARIYENIGSIFEDQHQHDSAHYYFSKALELNRQTGDSIASIEVYNNLGDLLRKKGRFREGLLQTHKALSLALSANEQSQVANACWDIAKMHGRLGNYDSAYYYMEQHRQRISRIFSRESGQQLALLQTIYDIEKKDNEIKLLSNHRKTTRITIAAIVIVSLLLAALAMLIISRQRLRIKNAQQLTAQERHIHQTRQALMEAALENKKLQELHLKSELEQRSKELSSYTLHVIQKNQLLEEVSNKLNELVKEERRDQRRQLKQLQLQISQSFNQDKHWEEFRNIFEQVHQSFFDNLRKYSDTLTANDIRMIALLKMNLAPNDMASLLGISPDSLRVIRYRLRKKLNLQQGESLSAFIQSL
jgi:tetratricopeptide (TPR) repeat protein